MKKNYIYAGLVGAAAIIVVLFFFGRTSDSILSANGQFSYDTTSKGFTSATTTINTTSTRVFATVNKVAYIYNNTAATITCSLDPSNTTAASSSVASGRGVMLAPAGSSTIPKIGVGQCYAGNDNCYLHTGAVNCLATSQVTVATVTQ